MSYAPRILIVEDERPVRLLFNRLLSEDGYSVTAVESAREALVELRLTECELVILDLSLPDIDGLDLIRQIRSRHPEVHILAMSGYMIGNVPDLARKAGADATLAKPMPTDHLRISVYELLDNSGTWRGLAANSR